ncbi:MAG TPA: aminotransferase class III-fold pyridoxal phosphate-dependent enzyme [Candidatus Nanoarchaeia archaeon]|nr:aminotransferase class III-fold pyridoxal phosphate-dependent enzyme [Candidatus Nanoarchaeia archaeon]
MIDLGYVLPILDKINIGNIMGGQGAQLFTDNGVYVDMFCDNGVVSLGYDYRNSELAHLPNAYKDDIRELASTKLCNETHCKMRYAFFTNSGTEAVESMMKFGRKYQSQFNKDKVYFKKGVFHGRTYGSMSGDKSGKAYHLDGYGPFVGETYEFSKVEEIDKNAAVVIITPAMVYDGFQKWDEDWFKKLSDYCEFYDILLGLDEVQTYIRLGEWWGYQTYHGIEPDMMAAAKGVAGGKPASVCLMKHKIGESIAKGGHFSTFGGNRTAMRGIIDFHKRGNGLMEKAINDGEYIKRMLKDKVKNLRGQGMMWSFDVENPINFRNKCLKNHVILGVFSNNQSIKLTPPLTIRSSSLEFAMEVLVKCL